MTQAHSVCQALKGVRSLSSHQYQAKFPITPDILRLLCQAISCTGFSAYDKLCLRAMFLLAYHAFLRPGEMCLSHHSLQLCNVNLQPTFVSLSFFSYKSSCGRCPCVFIPARSSSLCTVQALKAYLEVRGSAPGCLFINSQGIPITSRSFRQSLKQVVLRAGLSSAGITPHSFRVGAATAAAAVGIPEETIQRMGCWSSRAFLRYIRFQISRV